MTDSMDLKTINRSETKQGGRTKERSDPSVKNQTHLRKNAFALFASKVCPSRPIQPTPLCPMWHVSLLLLGQAARARDQGQNSRQTLRCGRLILFVMLFFCYPKQQCFVYTRTLTRRDRHARTLPFSFIERRRKLKCLHHYL